MLKLIKIFKEFPIHSMANRGFDKHNLNIALNNIKKEKEQIEKEYGDQIIALESDIDLLARSESLDYFFDSGNLYFYDPNNPNSIKIMYANGDFYNKEYVENKQLLDSIGARYQELKTALVIYDKYDIIKGKKLFDACLSEANFENKARVELRKINRNINKKSSEIFENTGLYIIKKNNGNISNVIFGTEDVDGAITKGVYLDSNSEWKPYSKNYSQNIEEKSILDNYMNLFNEYKDEYYKKCYINRCRLERHDNTELVKKERIRTIEKYNPDLEEERKIVK